MECVQVSMDAGQALNQCLGCSEWARRELFAHGVGDREGAPRRARAVVDELSPGQQEPLALRFKSSFPAVPPAAFPSVPGEKPVAFWVGSAGIVP